MAPGRRHGGTIARLMRACAGWVAAAVAATPGAATASNEGPANAESRPTSTDAYRQHMENGVKLFQDKNYEAALVEFEAAYKARPKASPLVNVALCQKALFRYPEAIETLERALAKHRDTMEEGDVTSAEQAIAEMRALLTRVIIRVVPPSATVLIDGKPLPTPEPGPGAGTRQVDLGPGTHRIGARADGFASAEESVTVVSGERGKTVDLALTPDKGYVTVDAGSSETAIAIDQQFAAYGRWAGFLPPGTHLVQIYRPGVMIYSAQVLVIAGKNQAIRPGQGGTPTTASGPAVTSPPIPPPPPKPAPVAPPRGPYVLGAAGLLWPLGKPRSFPSPASNSGGAGTLRLGYRVNSAAGFDLLLQYMNVAIDSETTDAKFTFESGRLGLNLHLMTPWETFRLTGSVGGGLAYDSVTFNEATAQSCLKPNDCFDAAGVNPFIFADAGVELDFSGAIVGFSLEGYFQSSRGLDDDLDRDLYEPRALVHLGGSLRAGYAFW